MAAQGVGSGRGAPDGVPRWFAQALETPPEHRDVVVAGARVHYRVWGAAGLPGLVLVHGGGAHSGWWDHVAPLLPGRRGVAVDLSGHGDSARREHYDMGVWADEVVAAAAAEDLGRPVVVGHSTGGWVAAATGAAHPGAVGGVAVLDSPLIDRPPEQARLDRRRRPTRVYATVEQAVERFVTVPEQDVVLPYVGAHVARESLRPVEGGWTWKFDPAAFGTRRVLRDQLPRLRCPAALFRSEHGLVSPAMAAEMAALAAGSLAVVDLPDTGHHPMLDQPLVLVAGLRTLLTLWAGR